jgi:ketosteroid isomerase-like protein/predicted esterase
MKNLPQLIALTALTLNLSSPMTPTTRAAEPLAPQTLNWQTAKQGKLSYLLYLPSGYDAQATKRWPLMLFLHGAGERGDNLEQVAVHGPPKLIRQGTNFPFIVVAPQCPSGERWQTDALLRLLDDLTARHAVDTNRLYVTGLSMGGYGTWSLGLAAPGRFAAIAPICGGANMIEALLIGGDQAQAIRALPVWAFHGAKDPVVPLEESARLVAALQRIGCPEVKLTVYPEAQHDSWTETYDNPEFYEWLLSHERGRVSPVANQAPAKKPANSDALLAADTAFAKLAAQKGAADAFFAYAAESATLLLTGELSAQGRDAIRQTMTALAGGELKWTPVAADLARSGDLGYTWGNYEYRAPATDGQANLHRGKYVTIWKKQPDGAWKFVLEISNPNSAPQ